MNILTILNSAPVGVLLGIIVTKSFDLINKRVDFKWESKKMLQAEKIKAGSHAVTTIMNCSNNYFEVNSIIDSMLKDEEFNLELFESVWSGAYEQLEETGKSVRDTYNQIHFYYDFEDELEIRAGAINIDFTKNISALKNLTEEDSIEKRVNAFEEHREILLRYIDINQELVKIIKEQT